MSDEKKGTEDEAIDAELAEAGGPNWQAATCPRCGGQLRGFRHDLGALSRSDNETTICSGCGEDEVIVWRGGQGLIDVLPSWAHEFRDGATRRQLLRADRKPDA